MANRSIHLVATFVTAVSSLSVIGCGGAESAVPPPATASSTSAAAIAPPTVPDAIKAPIDQSVFLKVSAKGAQVYECKAQSGAGTGASNAYAWSLKAPDAELFDDSGKSIGKHYAGPTWELADGSKIVAQKKAQADSPDASAVAWLLLEVKSTDGHGALTGVQSVQRVETSGGKAPETGCDAAHASAEARVPYTATYYFNGKR